MPIYPHLDLCGEHDMQLLSFYLCKLFIYLFIYLLEKTLNIVQTSNLTNTDANKINSQHEKGLIDSYDTEWLNYNI